MAPPVTLAEGSLRTTPFAHLLVSAHRKKLSGTLAIWPDDERKGQDRLRFEAGRIVAGRILERAETLERGILPIFRRERAPFAFYKDDLVGTGEGVAVETVEILPLVAAGLRGGGRDDVVDTVFTNYGTSPVTVSAAFDVRAFALTPKELSCIDALRVNTSTIAMFIATGGDPKTFRRVVYLLAITSNLERISSVGTQSGRFSFDALPSGEHALPRLSTPPPSGPPSAQTSLVPPSSPSAPRPSRLPPAERKKAKSFSAPPPPPNPPDGLAADQIARWDELTDRVIRSDTQNYFELLGVSEADGGAEARKAYFELVKRVHPDRLPPELAALRPHLEKLFQQVTEARETLEDDEKRFAYIRNVKNGGGTPASDRKLMGALAAAHELDKAQVLANTSRWTEVLDSVEDAKVYDPSQPDIYALEAWALFNLLGKSPLATTDKILALTEKVLLDPQGETNERARYTRALVLKKLGKESDAIVLLRAIVAKNPRHIDAAREVRLYDMRARDAAKPANERGSKLPEGAGFLSKLFGKKV